MAGNRKRILSLLLLGIAVSAISLGIVWTGEQETRLSREIAGPGLDTSLDSPEETEIAPISVTPGTMPETAIRARVEY